MARVAATLALIFVAPLTFAETVDCGADGCKTGSPTFDEYPAASVISPCVSSLDLTSHPKAPKYRTMLRHGVAKGANFAGHFAVVTWGCGTACLELAIVNTQSGQVYFPDGLQFNAYWFVPTQSGPPAFQFHISSNLLVAAGSINSFGFDGMNFFVWAEPNLTLIRSDRGYGWNEPPNAMSSN